MQRYLVSYDVRDPKRLRKVFKRMKGYGEHAQLSVFICDLTPSGLLLLRADLEAIIHEREDSVLIVDMGPVTGRGAGAVEFIGVRGENPVHGATVF